MSSHWHYQLMYHKYEKPNAVDGEGYYAIHEYYELEEGPAWTENPVTVDGDSIDDIRKMLICILKDCDTHGVKDYG